jgi:predicted acetyltransferase
MPTPPASEPLIRKLTEVDFDVSMRLGEEAFGARPTGAPPPTPEDFLRPGRHNWGTFVDDELVARMSGNEFASWMRGAEVRTSGIAGVTVVAEHRGSGLLRGLFRAVLEEATARGETISTLFPTAPGVYRGLGYEVVGSYDVVSMPASLLTTVAAPVDTTTRRARVDDVAAVRTLYDAWAALQNGPLTRRTVAFPATDAQLLESFTGITLAEDAGRPVGYALWDRGRGFGSSAAIEVEELIALTPDAARALWRMLGTFASVTGSVRVRTSGSDASRLVLPFVDWEVVERHPYMLRVHDVAGALTGLPTTLDISIGLRVAGDPLGTMGGDYRLVVAEGRSRCDRLGADGETMGDVPVLTPHGLALLYAGDQSCANLRLAGHLTGASVHDEVLDALLGHGQFHIRDFF